MLKRTKIMASVVALTLSAGAAWADGHAGPAADTVVATVNGTDITLGELVMMASQLPEQYQQLPDQQIFDGLLEQVIDQQLLADTLTEEPSRLEVALKNERRSLRAGEVLDEFWETPITDEELQAAYDARFADQEPTQEFNASHILVETEEEATEIKALIDGGADFAATAQERSTGPSGPNGGNLGWFGPGMMVAPFEEAVVALEAGEVSEPVQTQFGWHIVKLNETRNQSLPSLDDMRRELTNNIMRDRYNAHIDTLTEAAEITLPEAGSIDVSVIRNIELLED